MGLDSYPAKFSSSIAYFETTRGRSSASSRSHHGLWLWPAPHTERVHYDDSWRAEVINELIAVFETDQAASVVAVAFLASEQARQAAMPHATTNARILGHTLLGCDLCSAPT